MGAVVSTFHKTDSKETPKRSFKVFRKLNSQEASDRLSKVRKRVGKTEKQIKHVLGTLQGSRAALKLMVAMSALKNEIDKTGCVLLKHRHGERRDLYKTVEQLEEVCGDASNLLYDLRRDYATINPTRFRYVQGSKLVRALSENQENLRNLQESLKPKPLTVETMFQFPDPPKRPSFLDRFWKWAIPAILGWKGSN